MGWHLSFSQRVRFFAGLFTQHSGAQTIAHSIAQCHAPTKIRHVKRGRTIPIAIEITYGSEQLTEIDPTDFRTIA